MAYLISAARVIAEDHCDWCADHAGMAPWQVIQSVRPLGAPVPTDATWDGAVIAVMAAWVEVAKRDRRVSPCL